jgi:hypothetical protein
MKKVYTLCLLPLLITVACMSTIPAPIVNVQATETVFSPTGTAVVFGATEIPDISMDEVIGVTKTAVHLHELGSNGSPVIRTLAAGTPFNGWCNGAGWCYDVLLKGFVWQGCISGQDRGCE